MKQKEHKNNNRGKISRTKCSRLTYARCSFRSHPIKYGIVEVLGEETTLLRPDCRHFVAFKGNLLKTQVYLDQTQRDSREYK